MDDPLGERDLDAVGPEPVVDRAEDLVDGRHALDHPGPMPEANSEIDARLPASLEIDLGFRIGRDETTRIEGSLDALASPSEIGSVGDGDGDQRVP